MQLFLQVWGLLFFGSRASAAADGHLPATTARHVKRGLLEVKRDLLHSRASATEWPSASNHRTACPKRPTRGKKRPTIGKKRPTTEAKETYHVHLPATTARQPCKQVKRDLLEVKET